MPLEQNGSVGIFIFKNEYNENYIRLTDLIKWLKTQQQLTPNNELLHLLIRGIIKLNNENR